MTTLTIQERNTDESPERLRNHGRLPAVFYGPKEKSTSVSIVLKDFEGAWKEAGESTVLTLEGVGNSKEALIQEVQTHPITGVPRHVDFYIIEKGKKVQVNVPLIFEGVAPAEKELGGTLVKVLHELAIEADASKLPHEIVVDISVLKDFDTHISVKDIVLPEGVEAKENADETVALVSAQKEEEEEETRADVADVEVEKKGKKEEETGETESAEKSEEKK